MQYTPSCCVRVATRSSRSKNVLKEISHFGQFKLNHVKLQCPWTLLQSDDRLSTSAPFYKFWTPPPKKKKKNLIAQIFDSVENVDFYLWNHEQWLLRGRTGFQGDTCRSCWIFFFFFFFFWGGGGGCHPLCNFKTLNKIIYICQF